MAWFKKLVNNQEKSYDWLDLQLSREQWWSDTGTTELDDEEKLENLISHIEQLQSEGFYQLGKLYEEGKGVKKNCNQAKTYYRSAANLDHEEAKEKIAYNAKKPLQRQAQGSKHQFNLFITPSQDENKEHFSEKSVNSNTVLSDF